MTNHPYPRLSGAAIIAAPLLLLASTIGYVAGGEGMNVGEAAGAIQVWAMIAFAMAVVSLTRIVEAVAPRAAATLTIVGLIGAAGGVGYGIDSIQAAIFGAGSIQDTDSAVAPLALQIPGVLFPLSLIAIGVMLVRTGSVPRFSGLALVVGALLFPLSRIPDVEALALASDALLVVALVPMGWKMMRGLAARATGTRPVTVPAGATR